MAGSVNKVILVGNLGNEPEVRVSQDNKKLVRLSIATSENWKDKVSGERKSKTEWHRVVIFATGLADMPLTLNPQAIALNKDFAHSVLFSEKKITYAEYFDEAIDRDLHSLSLYYLLSLIHI